MIMLCERCFAPIADEEPVVRLFVPADHGVHGSYRYQQLGGSSRCVPPRLVPHGRPDQDRRQGSAALRPGD